MATQQAILEKIRSALSDVNKNNAVEPAPPKVWDTENLPLQELSARFQENLEAVKGELVPCENVAQVAEKINELLGEINAKKIAVMERPLCRTVAELLNGRDGREWVFPPQDAADVSAQELSKMDAGLLSPEYLLSDTGSCFFAAPAAFERLTTYITPVSLVVAEESMLRENLPTLWKEMEPRLQTAATGEFVIVTGPSRTADIEKILVLGVHGPRRVIVFLLKSSTGT